MSARLRQQRAASGLLGLAFALALVWPGAAGPAAASGDMGAGRLGGVASGAVDHELAIRGQRPLGAPAAERRGERGPVAAASPVVPASALAAALLLGLAALLATARRPFRRSGPRPAAPRAPPFLQHV